MDPLSSLAVACAVVQFVDAGCSAVKKCKEVYVSAGGSTKRNAELTAYSERLETFLTSLKDPASAPDSHEIFVLQRKCLVTAGKLQDAIRKTNVILPAKGRQRFVRALFGTARSLWWEKDIAEIEKRLYQYRLELDESLLKEVYNNVQESLPEIQHRLTSLSKDQRRMAEALMSGQMSVEGMVGSIDRLTDQVNQLQSSLQQREEERINQVKAEELRASLRFPNLSQRQTKIRKQGEGTFAWLLEPPDQLQSNRGDRPTLEHSFVDWLTTDDEKLYWIWGKAGSGKSTLMKMLCMTERSRVTDLLQEWSAARPVLLPAYFFWRSGDDDRQKSIQGLLQTLLSRIVEGAHELTMDLTNSSDETWNVTSDGWTTEQLEGALHRILARHDRPHICFFIDGLDEIEERPDELIRVIQTVCRYDGVKVCASSRPEYDFVEFSKSLGPLPHLRLEVINAVDIAAYTDSRLHSIAGRKDDLSDLAREIKSRAQGVFIWVDYVIQYMATPIKQGESMEDLIARLEHTPKKVEELYEAMFKDMGSFELKEAAMLFRLALLPGTNIDIATCITMLHQEKLRSSTYDFSMDVVDGHLIQFTQRLRSRCHGLLEPTDREQKDVPSEMVSSDQMLQFTHRTAATFATRALESGILPPTPLETVYGQLCKATARLLYAKSKTRSPVTPQLRPSLRKPFIRYDPDVTEVFEVRRTQLFAFFSWCRLAYPDNEKLVIQELDDLAKRIELKQGSLLNFENGKYSDTFMWAALLGTTEHSEHLCAFDTLCVTEDLVKPVFLKLDRLDWDARREAYTYLLAVTLLLLREKWGKPYKRSPHYPFSILRVIRTLIDSGADVNAPIIAEMDGLYTGGPASCWQFFLTTVIDPMFPKLYPGRKTSSGYMDQSFSQLELHSALKSITTTFVLFCADPTASVSTRYILEEWNYEQHENGTWAIYVEMSATLSLYFLYVMLGHDELFWDDLSRQLSPDEPAPARVLSVERHTDPARARTKGRMPLWQWDRRSEDSSREIDGALVSVLNAKEVFQGRTKPQTVTWIGGTQPYHEIEEIVSFTNLLKRMQARDGSGQQSEGEPKTDGEEDGGERSEDGIEDGSDSHTWQCGFPGNLDDDRNDYDANLTIDDI